LFEIPHAGSATSIIFGHNFRDRMGAVEVFEYCCLLPVMAPRVNGTRQIPEAFISREFLQISFDIVSRYRNGTCGTIARSNPF